MKKQKPIIAYMWSSAIGCCNLVSFDKGTADFLSGFGELAEIKITGFKIIKKKVVAIKYKLKK